MASWVHFSVFKINLKEFNTLAIADSSLKLELATPVRKDSKTSSPHCVPDATL